VVFDLGFSILPLCPPFFYARVRVSPHSLSLFFLFSFFSVGWRASDEPLLMDFIDECAWWMTKVLDDHDISRKATMFNLAQNVKR